MTSTALTVCSVLLYFVQFSFFEVQTSVLFSPFYSSKSFNTDPAQSLEAESLNYTSSIMLFKAFK